MTERTAQEWTKAAQEAAPLPLRVAIVGEAMDPIYGKIEGTVSVFRLDIADEWYSMRQKLGQVVNGFLRETFQNAGLQNQAEWRSVAMRLAVPSLLLDLPQMERLIDRFPSTLHTPIDRDCLHHFHASDGPNYSLYGLAFLYAKNDAMDAIFRVVKSHIEQPGMTLDLGWAKDSEKTFGPAFDVSHLGDRGVQLHRAFYPSVFFHAVNQSRQLPVHGVEQEARLVNMAHLALDRNNASSFQPHVPAFLALGLYEAQPDKSFRLACTFGHVDVVKALEGLFSWDETDLGQNWAQSPVMLALRAAQDPVDEDKKRRHEDTLIEVARQSIEDPEKRFFRPIEGFPKGDRGVAQPLSDVIQAKFNRLLVAFLDQGWSANLPALPNSETPMAVAKACGNEAAIDLMVSHCARRKAHALLRDFFTLRSKKP